LFRVVLPVPEGATTTYTFRKLVIGSSLIGLYRSKGF
jgi:hypothetical protein